MSVLSDIGSLASPVVGGVLGMIGAGQQNSAQQVAVQNQEAYQTQMSNTAHQRDVADLKAAGLNPILSANAGSSTPTGAMPSTTNVMEPLANSASEVGKNIQQQRQLDLQQQGIENQNEKIKSDIGVNQKSAALIDAQTQKALNDSQNSATDAKRNDLMFQYDKKFMNFDQIQKRIQNGLNLGNSAKDLINPLKGLLGPGGRYMDTDTGQLHNLQKY